MCFLYGSLQVLEPQRTKFQFRSLSSISSVSISSSWKTWILELCPLIIPNHYSKCPGFLFVFYLATDHRFPPPPLSMNYPLGWITDQPSCRPVTKQLLSVAICSGWKEREASRPCYLAYWIRYLLLEEWTMWHFRYVKEIFYSKTLAAI